MRVEKLFDFKNFQYIYILFVIYKYLFIILIYLLTRCDDHIFFLLLFEEDKDKKEGINVLGRL